MRGQILCAETQYPDLLPLGHYPCYTCFRVLPASLFTDHSKRKGKGIGGPKADGRSCLSCGMKDNVYPTGARQQLNRKAESACLYCARFVFDGDKHSITPVHCHHQIVKDQERIE